MRNFLLTTCVGAVAAVLSGVGGWAGIGLAAGLTEPTAGLGAVGGYAGLKNYTSLGGQLTVFALP
jgi:lanthanide-dependent methanol dehydrogenase